MLYLYVSQENPRIHFIMNLIWKQILGTEVYITNNKENFLNYVGPKISYCQEQCGEGIHIQPVSLLFEKGIKKQPIEIVEWNHFHLFFPTPLSALPFDPFAVCFYLVTRYEEYIEGTRHDEHGRFRIIDSVAYQLGFHRIPIVNLIAEAIATLVQKQFPKWKYQQQKYHFLPTFDVDIAYRYKGKTPIRFCGSLAKAILKFDIGSATKLTKSLFINTIDDDFNTFAHHEEIAKKNSVRPIHFILTAPFGKYDRNINFRSKAFRELIQQLQTFSDIGLHPSYYTLEKPSLVAKEKARLEEIVGKPITKSRQHFLKLRFPDTFRTLEACGILEDYTLGWPDEVGFRASITTPFPFYDLELERESKLIIHPLHIMDGALLRCCNTSDEYELTISELRRYAEQYGGEFITLQHNSSGVQIMALQ